MKHTIRNFAATAALTVSCLSAHAESDWACDIVLCLANPQGWQAVPYCIPPVKKLIKHLIKNPWPSCAAIGAHAARIRRVHYESCPDGFVPQEQFGFPSAESLVSGRRDNENSLFGPFSGPVTGAPKLCIGKRVNTQFRACTNSYVDNYQVVRLPFFDLTFRQVTYAAATPVVLNLFPSDPEAFRRFTTPGASNSYPVVVEPLTSCPIVPDSGSGNDR